MVLAQRLQTAIEHTHAEISQEWPEVLEYFSHKPALNPLPIRADEVRAHSSKDEEHISNEERTALIEQLRAVTALPPGHFDPKTAEELSLKLSYLIGRSVSFYHEEKSITYAHGAVRAMRAVSTEAQPLWIKDPLDKGLTQKSSRSDEWGLHISPRDVSASLRLEWQQPWFLYRSVLLINPITFKAVVGQITGILTDRLHRYQFGASPALIRAGEFWSPGKASGRGIVCFLGESMTNGTVVDLDILGS